MAQDSIEVKAAAQLFRVFADPTRLRILHLLQRAGELCVGDIVSVIRAPQATVSRHLAYLRRHRAVRARRLGLWVYYRLAKPESVLGAVVIDHLERCLAGSRQIVGDLRRLEQARQTGCCCAPPPSPTAVPLQPGR